MSGSTDEKIGFWEVTAIGIGGMVGGGIFAVLGLSVDLTHGGAPVAFLLAGIVALVTSYSYTRLSVSFSEPGRHGGVPGPGVRPRPVDGRANILLWISYIVMLSLYAYAFGSYGASLFPSVFAGVLEACIDQRSHHRHHRAESVERQTDRRGGRLDRAHQAGDPGPFIAVGIWGIDGARLAPSAWSPPLNVIAGGMIIFLAYEGFELIANSAQDVRSPARPCRAPFILRWVS